MNIQEIAKLANVSISTVSKVMNGKDKDISKATRDRVLRIIEENNYVPYAQYRAKEELLNRFIGLVIQRENPYRECIVSVVEETLSERGFHLVMRTIGPDPYETDAAVEELQKRGVLGVLVNASKAVSGHRGDPHLVYFSDTGSFEDEQKNTFYYHKYEAGKLAAKEVLKRGHRNIGCILKDELSVLEGVKAMYREQNLPVELINYYVGRNLETIQRNGVPHCVNDTVSAVICEDMEIAGCILEYTKATGISIPKELSIICIRDHEALKYLAGGITAVRFPIRRMMEDAVNHLLQMITEKKYSEVERKFNPEVITRGSIQYRSHQPVGEKIVVVGCMNADNIIAGARIPVNGETQIADNILTSPGGKGGNQAVGVGRLGGQAYMIGRIGKDADGRMLYKSLTDNGVHTDGVEFDNNLISGKAFVHIDREGENTIVVYRGANGGLGEGQLKRHKELFRNAKYCLLSSEIPEEAITAVIENCKENGTEIILKPSAIDDIDEEALSKVDYLVPNEKEMKQISVSDISLEEKAEKLLKSGVKNVIVTLGKRGAYLRNREYSMYFPSAPFTAVDSTGGADAFISAMAVALSEGKDLIYSIIYGTFAAGITITRYGVQEAMPDKKTINIYKDEIEKQYLERINERK